MASDDGCAPRSAERIASVHRFGLVTLVGLKGSDVVLLATGDYLGDTRLCRTGKSPLPKNEAYRHRRNEASILMLTGSTESLSTEHLVGP
jgi:hypothetical protein